MTAAQLTTRGTLMSKFKIKHGLQASALGQGAVSVSGTDVDLSLGTYFSKTISGATTLTFSNPPLSGFGQAFQIEITGDGSAITWPTSIDWDRATTPPVTASGKVDVFNFLTVDNGTSYVGKKTIEGAS